MRIRTLVGTALSFVALSASIAGVTAGVAEAAPRPGQCAGIYQNMSDAIDIAQAAYAQGDEAGVDSWMEMYEAASATYKRLRCG